MRIHRLHTDHVLEPEISVSLSGNAAHYLSRVLRAVPGQSIVLFNGDGHDYAADIESFGKDHVAVRITARLPAAGESPLHITLALALSRGERMDQALQKSTELGAAAFQPLITDRTGVRLRPHRLQKRLAHWRGVIISACEQSGRARIPELNGPVKLEAWLERSGRHERYALHAGAERRLSRCAPGQTVQIAVGPEGGFSQREVDEMTSAGVLAVSLGPRTLRTETAGPAAIAVLQAVAGDFGK